MLRNQFFEETDFTYAKFNVESRGTEYLLAYDLHYLKCLFDHGHDQSLQPNVRSKYLTTWEIYRQEYKGLCSVLEDSGFDFDSTLDINLTPHIEKIGTPEGAFG